MESDLYKLTINHVELRELSDNSDTFYMHYEGELFYYLGTENRRSTGDSFHHVFISQKLCKYYHFYDIPQWLENV